MNGPADKWTFMISGSNCVVFLFPRFNKTLRSSSGHRFTPHPSIFFASLQRRRLQAASLVHSLDPLQIPPASSPPLPPSNNLRVPNLKIFYSSNSDSYSNIDMYTSPSSCEKQKQKQKVLPSSGSTPKTVVDADIRNQLENLGISRVKGDEEGGVQITCFSDVFNDTALHFQIIRLPKQIYAWIGFSSSKFGGLYAAAPTRPNNGVSVSSLLGGTSDNTGSGIARRMVMKTGLPVMLACNIPKDNLMLEAEAEKKLVQKLIALGYTKSKHQVSSS